VTSQVQHSVVRRPLSGSDQHEATTDLQDTWQLPPFLYETVRLEREFETPSPLGQSLPNRQTFQQTEPDLYFNLSPSTLPQDPAAMTTDGFLDTIFAEDQQQEFTIGGLDALLDQTGSTSSEPSASSITNNTLPHPSIGDQDSGQLTQSSEGVDDMTLLDCSPNLAEHL